MDSVLLFHLAVQQRCDLAGVRAVGQDAPGRCAQRRQILLQDKSAAVQDPDARALLFDLGEQVTGQEDRHPAAVEVQQEPAGVPDAVRFQAAAGLGQDQQPRPPDQRGGQAEPLAHAEGVVLDRPAVDAGQADLFQRVVDAAPPGPPPPVRAGRVQQLQVRPPRQVRVGAGPFHQRAHVTEDPVRVPGDAVTHHLDLAAGREHQAQQHADESGLAGAVGPEQPVAVAVAHADVHGVHRGDGSVSLGQ